VISSIESNPLNAKMQQALFSAYDIVLHISKDTIQFKGSTEKKQINYSIKDNKVTLEPLFTSNYSRIKDIFDISPEETDTLDRIVKKHIDVHKEILI
jgi:c-di-AMP phosphodiesterase-like protein